MSKRHRGPKGTAYNEAISKSQLARQGGPIRLARGSIQRNSTEASLKAAATARGWRIIEAGFFWLLIDARTVLHPVTMDHLAI